MLLGLAVPRTNGPLGALRTWLSRYEAELATAATALLGLKLLLDGLGGA